MSISAMQLRSTVGAKTGIVTWPSASAALAQGGGVLAEAAKAGAALEGGGASAEAEAATRGTRGAKAAPKEPGGASATASRRAAVSAFFHFDQPLALFLGSRQKVPPQPAGQLAKACVAWRPAEAVALPHLARCLPRAARVLRTIPQTGHALWLPAAVEWRRPIGSATGLTGGAGAAGGAAGAAGAAGAGPAAGAAARAAGTMGTASAAGLGAVGTSGAGAAGAAEAAAMASAGSEPEAARAQAALNRAEMPPRNEERVLAGLPCMAWRRAATSRLGRKVSGGGGLGHRARGAYADGFGDGGSCDGRGGGGGSSGMGKC
eukprot:scaffold29258_cov58-Phaeocystis_antarctica.AAC.1